MSTERSKYVRSLCDYEPQAIEWLWPGRVAAGYDEVLLESALGAMHSLGLEPDPWQLDVLVGKQQRLLLNCCRQSGKSTTVALLSVLETVGIAGTRVLMVAPSLRQSRLLFRIASDYLSACGMHFVKRRTMHEINLKNGSLIACLPCKEETIRGYASVMA